MTENARLKAKAIDQSNAITSQRITMREMQGNMQKLESQNEALKADAERLDFLIRAKAMVFYEEGEGCYLWWHTSNRSSAMFKTPREANRRSDERRCLMECKRDMRTKLVGDGCEACTPTLALEYAKQTIADQTEDLARVTKERDELRKTIFSNTHRAMVIDHRFFVAESGFISDENFDFDAGLTVGGDFVDDEKQRYAQMIACTLNNAAQAMKERDEALADAARLRTMLTRIAAIEDKLVGPDWEEIEEARAVASEALAATPANALGKIEAREYRVGDAVSFRGDEYKIFANGDRPGTFDICLRNGKPGDRWMNVPPCAFDDEEKEKA